MSRSVCGVAQPSPAFRAVSLNEFPISPTGLLAHSMTYCVVAASRAAARGDDDETADIDLEVYQYDSDERWFTNVMHDFERLSGGRVS